ncbi:MAG: winged helix-turn-helix transcriptional regulator, partial [Candidatus Micrarchaeia archaeon]
MPANKKLQEYVKNELPYKILQELYKDSRTSLLAMARKFGVSNHTVEVALKELESKYGLAYVLQLDEKKLGLVEGKIITIKFDEQPDLGKLKESLQKDVYVQDAYFSQGDFDLIMYVTGLESEDFNRWQFSLRKRLFEYGPRFSLFSIWTLQLGFLPIRNEIIADSTELNSLEKKILMLLNENSRIKMKELVKRAKTTQTKAIYVIRKLKEKGIIKRFSTLVQNPEKRLYMAYGTSHMPSMEHDKLLLQYLKLIVSEDLHKASNDYALIIDGVGSYDALYICDFSKSEDAQKSGPEVLKTLWAHQHLKVEKAILTDLIVGKWPFHLESYELQHK